MNDRRQLTAIAQSNSQFRSKKKMSLVFYHKKNKCFKSQKCDIYLFQLSVFFGFV